MDWLRPKGAVIDFDFEQQLVRIQTPSGGELVVQGKLVIRTTTLGSDLICFHRNQRGHKMAQCLILDVMS